jgi:PAS domain S-box-containing protein
MKLPEMAGQRSFRRRMSASNYQPAPDHPDVVSSQIDAAWKWHDETNVLLRAAIESANDAIIITEAILDPPGPRIEYVNPAFTAMTGYSREEVLGKTPRILQGPKTDRKLLERLRADLKAERLFHGETINYRKDGSEYRVEWRITALRGADGKILKWVAVQRDVTERHMAEERREQLLDAERTARTEAERLGRMKDEFLATVSHELRTPLNAILGWAQLLGTGRLTEADVRRAIETVVRNARTQGQLIDELLDMSRIMSGKVRLDMTALQMAEVLETSVHSLKPTADAKNVRLELQPPPADCAVMGDANRLQQIFWNLLSNAIKFTQPGGIIGVSTQVAGSQLDVHVRDNGQGIDPTFLPYVFERFRQADSSTTRTHGGLGLGLSIVKQLAELHGGSVRVESDGVGQGSRFTVTLPLIQTRAGDLPAQTPPETDDGSERDGALDDIDLAGTTMLIVDDDPDARSFVRFVLQQAGAKVIEADNAEQALIRLHEGVPDVMISDIGMPTIDGYELIRQIRALPDDAQRNVPAIALTAFTRSEDRRRALLAGYQSHLAKPIDTIDLIIEVASLCGRAG